MCSKFKNRAKHIPPRLIDEHKIKQEKINESLLETKFF